MKECELCKKHYIPNKETIKAIEELEGEKIEKHISSPNEINKNNDCKMFKYRNPFFSWFLRWLKRYP